MAPPITYYMNYIIFFRDPAEYAFALGVAGSPLLEMSPRQAASIFAIPYPYPSGNVDIIPKGILFPAPYTPGSEIGFPEPSGVFVDDSVLEFTVPAQQGYPPVVWPAGPDGLFIWSGNIVLSSGAGAATTPPGNVMSERRWIDGFEWNANAEGGGSSNTAGLATRDASRTIDGCGLAIRGTNSSINNHQTAEYRTGLTPATSWERFYFRVRRLPTVNPAGLWRCHGTPSNGAGFALQLETTGAVSGISINATNTQVNEGTVFTPVLLEWNRVDIFLKFHASGVGTSGIIKVYVNGILVYTFTDNIGHGLNNGTSHNNSDLGQWNSPRDNNVEIDMDDWVNADLPANVDVATLLFLDDLFPIDWLLGSHIRKYPVRSSSVVGWTGAGVQTLNSNLNPVGSTQYENLQSSTSAAQIIGLTGALGLGIQDCLANVLGPVAATAGINTKNAASTDGDLGYKIAGAAAVVATINQTAANLFFSVLYHPSGNLLPVEISPYSIVHTKSADANLDTTNGMSNTIEFIGVWAEEDDPTYTFPVSRLSYLHNCRYANTAWGYYGSTVASPVFSVSATYVGTGAYQEISLPGPCHFLFIRALTGGTKPAWVMGAGLSSRQGGIDEANGLIQMFADSAGDIWFSVDGTGVNWNAIGVTYQYEAFCDPGNRFLLCTSMAHSTTGPTPPIANTLIDPAFTPEACWAGLENINGASNATGAWYKGPGHTGNNATALVGTAVTTFGNFATGVFNSDVTLHNASLQTALNFWRTTEPNCGGVMVQLGTYTGNGSSPRTITVTPTSGRAGHFVYVQPAGAVGIFRDASHAGANSCNISALTNTTSGITAIGTDSFTVQSTLNANGVLYHYFILPGDVASALNGVYFNPMCETPVGPHVAPSLPSGDINVIGDGGLIFDGTPGTTLLKDVSGIYTLTPGQRHDTFYDRQTGQTSVNVAIPDPTFKTGYVGG
jgi:hypothetical protein